MDHPGKISDHCTVRIGPTEAEHQDVAGFERRPFASLNERGVIVVNTTQNALDLLEVFLLPPVQVPIFGVYLGFERFDKPRPGERPHKQLCTVAAVPVYAGAVMVRSSKPLAGFIPYPLPLFLLVIHLWPFLLLGRTGSP